MKKLLWAIPLAVSLLLSDGLTDVQAAGVQQALPLNASGELSPPENTACHRIEYDSSANTKRAKSPANLNGNLELYDLCIGTYPKYPSTSVEQGIDPIYYAKYYFFPEPMPYYNNITWDGTTAGGTTVRGLDQKVNLNQALEKRDEPSHNDIFIFYPFDKSHTTAAPLPNANITGPYQIGYNSFYHNTYRARYFAADVNFTFELLEPKEGSVHKSKFKDKTYLDKTPLFQGEIYYKLEDDPTSPGNCFRDDFLDYEDDCRSIEFYFPKGTIIDKSKTVPVGSTKGELINKSDITANPDERAINVVPKERISYRNPGEHVMVFYAEENLQLRLQKDLGTEYQTKGNKTDAQNEKPIENTIRHFNRNDVDINGDAILPITNITKVYNENYRKAAYNTTPSQYQVTVHNGKSVADSTYDITKMVGGHYEYEWQQDYLNYCTKDTDIWGNVDSTYRENNNDGGTNQTSFQGMNQRDKNCYHDEGKELHFWQYDWGNTGWYAAQPHTP